MSSEGISIPAPLFVTWFQCVVTAGICYLAGELGEKMRANDYTAVSKEENDGEADEDGAG